MNKQLTFLSVLLLLAGCSYLPSWMGGAEKVITRLPGEREDVLRAESGFKADESVQSVPFKLPAAIENTAWAQHTGQVSAATGNLGAKGDLTRSDRGEVGKGNEFSHTLVPRPVVADGRIYVMDAEGYISAHDANDIGKKLWVSEALSGKDEVMGGGLAVEGGKLYATSGIGQVAALDATSGAGIWHRNIGVPLRSAPRVSGGKVFVITIDSQMFALDATTGSTLWSHRGIGETAGLMNSVSPTIAADTVIVPYASGELYALKLEDGTEVWRESLAQAKRTEATAIFSGIGGDPVVDEQVVFAVSSSGLISVFNILNGQPLWQGQLASINTPWLVGDYLYALSEDNVLVAIVKYDGRIRWSSQLKQYGDAKRKLNPIVWRGPVMMDGKLILVSSQGEMITIDASSGGVLAIHDVADDIATSPVVANGTLYVVNKDAKLYSYQ